MMACVNNIDSNNAVAGRNRQIAKVRMPSLLMLFFDLVDDGLFFFNYNMASFYCFHRKEYEKKGKTVFDCGRGDIARLFGGYGKTAIREV